jgi:hypothetical protein
MTLYGFRLDIRLLYHSTFWYKLKWYLNVMIRYIRNTRYTKKLPLNIGSSRGITKHSRIDTQNNETQHYNKNVTLRITLCRVSFLLSVTILPIMLSIVMLNDVLSASSGWIWTGKPGNTEGGSITVGLTWSLTALESAVWQLTIFLLICKTD